MEKHVTRVLAEYIHGLRPSSLTEAERDAAICCIFDLVTAVIAGFHEASVRSARQVADKIFSPGPVPIWFSGALAGANGAAFANSAAASVLDLDDGNRLARGHPGAAVIPAAFATAAEEDSDLEEVLAAIVAGYEVSVAVAASRGFYARTGMWCGYGAVAAAGWLRKSSPDVLSHALAISGATAPNLMCAGGAPIPKLLGNDVKEGIPWGTATGMAALLLAQSGQAGSEDILDHAPHHAAERLVESVGRSSFIQRTYFKFHACCRHIHAPIEALLATLKENSLTPMEVGEIEVHTYDAGVQLTNRVEPANLVDVQYSIPYCLAIVALLGEEALLPLEGSVLGRPDLVAFARRVRVMSDPEINLRFPRESPARVVIRARGRIYESPVTLPRGEPGTFSWSDLEQKFVTATRHALDERLQYRFMETFERLRKGEISGLLRLMSEPVLDSGFEAKS